jgi:transcriptional regulator with XRE-family HTH domain
MKVNDMSEMGSRLREERKRLGMNQTDFAKAIGVHLNTQSRYEKGDRDPDTAYLSAIAKAGVNVAYVLTGEKGEDPKLQIKGLRHVINVIQEFLDIAKGPIGREFDAAAREVCEAYKVFWSDPAKSDQADRMFWALLQKSPIVFANLWRLEELIEQVDMVAEKMAFHAEIGQKARAAVSLYREEKRTGTQADWATVGQVIRRS